MEVNALEAKPNKKLKIKVVQRAGTDVQNSLQWAAILAQCLGFTFCPSK